jgi:hypothetical protein
MKTLKLKMKRPVDCPDSHVATIGITAGWFAQDDTGTLPPKHDRALRTGRANLPG